MIFQIALASKMKTKIETSNHHHHHIQIPPSYHHFFLSKSQVKELTSPFLISFYFSLSSSPHFTDDLYIYDEKIVLFSDRDNY